MLVQRLSPPGIDPTHPHLDRIDAEGLQPLAQTRETSKPEVHRSDVHTCIETVIYVYNMRATYDTIRDYLLSVNYGGGR